MNFAKLLTFMCSFILFGVGLSAHAQAQCPPAPKPFDVPDVSKNTKRGKMEDLNKQFQEYQNAVVKYLECQKGVLAKLDQEIQAKEAERKVATDAHNGPARELKEAQEKLKIAFDNYNKAAKKPKTATGG